MTTPHLSEPTEESSFRALGEVKFREGVASLGALGVELERIAKLKERDSGAIFGLQTLEVQEALKHVGKLNMLKIAVQDSVAADSVCAEPLRRNSIFGDGVDEEQLMTNLKRKVGYQSPKDNDLLSVAIVSELYRNGGNVLSNVSSGVRELLGMD